MFFRGSGEIDLGYPQEFAIGGLGKAIAAQLIPAQKQDWILSEMGDTGFEPVTPSV